MESVFEVPELLILIFEELSLSRTDIFAVSRVCKTWNHFALDIAGRHYPAPFDSLVGALGLSLPPPPVNVVYWRLRGELQKYEEIQDHITEGQWKRFIHLSGYVQKLVVTKEWSNKSLMIALSNLMLKHGGQPFQNLHSISFSSISFVQGFTFPLCCLSPNLRSVTAESAEQDSEGADCIYLIEALKDNCPDLEEVILPQQSRPIRMASLSFFRGLKTLKYNGPISPYVLTSIGQCHNLRSLTLITSSLPRSIPVDDSLSSLFSEDNHQWLNSSSDQMMPNMEEIDLSRVDLSNDSVIDTLSRSKLSFPSLKRVAMTDWAHQSLSWLERLLQGSPHITQVYLTIRKSLHLPLMDCLLRYRHIRRIHLFQSGRRMYGSLANIPSWLASMPWLEAFELTVTEQAYSSSTGLPTFTTLPQLISGHPKLQVLAIPFDSRHLPGEANPKLSSDSETNRVSPSLDYLKLRSSTSLKSLKLFLFNNRRQDVQPTFNLLVDLLPERVELTILVRPIQSQGFTVNEECVKSSIAESEFSRLLEVYRAEKKVKR
ncbi:hypothetical protein FRC03_000266 [Tulasnella sp. 419]|nr:hypothetical protein FRC03_000266 [Tulasnella sp. 419]